MAHLATKVTRFVPMLLLWLVLVLVVILAMVVEAGLRLMVSLATVCARGVVLLSVSVLCLLLSAIALLMPLHFTEVTYDAARSAITSVVALIMFSVAIFSHFEGGILPNKCVS